jgi:imidazole glycerol-phosphate synthase subunit HisH
MIIILDYGMGNPSSVLNMLRKSGGEGVITADPSLICKATAIILPGVGSFDNGITKLEALGVLDILVKKVVNEKTPFLGICLGMQLLFERSEEGDMPGLGWIKGEIKKFDFSTIENQETLKIPHMGWNLVYPANSKNIFNSLKDETRFYFVHSYHVVCKNQDNVLATSQYGYNFTCAVRKDNIFGVQFHPEKSHRFGLTLFKNFLEYVNC